MRYRQTGSSVGCTLHVQIQRRLYSALRIIRNYDAIQANGEQRLCFPGFAWPLPEVIRGYPDFLGYPRFKPYPGVAQGPRPSLGDVAAPGARTSVRWYELLLYAM